MQACPDSYPQAMARLEQIAGSLSHNVTDIDELVASVHEAAILIKACRQKLRNAQAQIEAALADMETEE